MTELRDVIKFTPFNKSVDATTGCVIGIHVFPEIDPEIYRDIDGKSWGMVAHNNIFGQKVMDGAMRWFTLEELEKEDKKLLNAMTNAMRFLEV